MDRCPICGRWATERHRCPPAWRVWCPDRGQIEENARVVWADHDGEAAERWAERSDAESADYSIVRGDEVEVHVRALHGERVSRWTVEGEAVPAYHARRIGGSP